MLHFGQLRVQAKLIFFEKMKSGHWTTLKVTDRSYYIGLRVVPFDRSMLVHTSLQILSFLFSLFNFVRCLKFYSASGPNLSNCQQLQRSAGVMRQLFCFFQEFGCPMKKSAKARSPLSKARKSAQLIVTKPAVVLTFIQLRLEFGKTEILADLQSYW